MPGPLITYQEHPRFGPIIYGCIFGAHKGKPYFYEVTMHLRERTEVVDSRKACMIREYLANTMKRDGVPLEDYPEKDIRRIDKPARLK